MLFAFHVNDPSLPGYICPFSVSLAAIGLSTGIFLALKTNKRIFGLCLAVVSALGFIGEVAHFSLSLGSAGNLTFILTETLELVGLGLLCGVVAFPLLLTAKRFFGKKEQKEEVKQLNDKQ
ncbi:MAG: hypothetical protein ACRC2T_08635 [Thermoguttaceae bacterium]